MITWIYASSPQEVDENVWKVEQEKNVNEDGCQVENGENGRQEKLILQHTDEEHENQMGRNAEHKQLSRHASVWT